MKHEIGWNMLDFVQLISMWMCSEYIWPGVQINKKILLTNAKCQLKKLIFVLPVEWEE